MPKKSVKVMSTAPPEPMIEQAIRQRAYELYIKRGMAPGHALDDWLQAEAELIHDHKNVRFQLTATDYGEIKSGDQHRIKRPHSSTD